MTPAVSSQHEVDAGVGVDIVGARVGDAVGTVGAIVGEVVGASVVRRKTSAQAEVPASVTASAWRASECVDPSKPSEGTTLRTVNEGAPKSEGLMHAHAKDQQRRTRRRRSQRLETATPSHHHSDRRTSVRLQGPTAKDRSSVGDGREPGTFTKQPSCLPQSEPLSERPSALKSEPLSAQALEAPSARQSALLARHTCAK